jgi:arginine-tRNA-protein transferase
MRLWHGCLRESTAEFEAFLCESPTDTIELSYRDRSGLLLAVGILDVCSRSLSSVYFYFDPSQPRRGLGTFGALMEIQLARSRGILHYYLGYWIDGCRGMSYKNSFRPYQILSADGIWRNASD